MSEIKKEYYKPGQLYYKNGQRHGIAKRWYESGLLYSETPYENSQRHGIAKYWFESGQLRYEIPYQNGQRHGISKHWHESGKFNYEIYHLYGEEVTKEEYCKHELVEKLSWLK